MCSPCSTPSLKAQRGCVARSMRSSSRWTEACCADARELQRLTGFRTILCVPLMREDTVIGVITIRRLDVEPFTDKQTALAKTFADQAVIAIENVRLFHEIEEKSKQLEAANRHKSEFLAR